MLSQLRTMWEILKHSFTKAETVQYPEEQPYLSPRYRGRIVLTRDPDGEERCVACNLCAAVCPVDCIALQKDTREDGSWYPEFFRINFCRCIMCGMCEEASSHIPHIMQRQKLIRKNSGYQLPSSRVSFCRAIQSTGHTAAQRLQATQRSSPSGSRVSTMRPR